jgi:cysteine desulfurase
MRTVYLDHTATTPLDPAVFEAMRPYFLDKFGNASSIHRFGQEARAALDASRDAVAARIGARPGELFFTGSGTESDNFALKGAALAMRERGKRHIITCAAEHHAVLETCRFLEGEGFSVTYLLPDADGMAAPEHVVGALRPETGLVSIMHANNEVGTINPVAEIARAVRARGVLVHADAVQTFGKIPVDVAALGVDLLSLSAHKLYGPKGIGALFIRKGVALHKFMHGGGQERGRRGGTENVPLAVGFAEAAKMAAAGLAAEQARLEGLRGILRASLAASLPGLFQNGHPREALPHIVNVSFDDRSWTVDGEALLFGLDLAGIAVTSGSACTSGSMEPSHVLLAMGRTPATAKATIRFSMGRSTTEEDLAYAVAALVDVVARIAKRRPTAEREPR